MTRQVDEYVKRMKRRRDYLEQTADNNHFAKSELAALEWAISYIEDTVIDASDHQNKYFEHKKEGTDDKNKVYTSGHDTDDSVREPTT